VSANENGPIVNSDKPYGLTDSEAAALRVELSRMEAEFEEAQQALKAESSPKKVQEYCRLITTMRKKIATTKARLGKEVS